MLLEIAHFEDVELLWPFFTHHRFSNIDIIFNPLEVPPRMNIGHIFECSLRHFDERYKQKGSRKLVLSKLYKACKQTANPCKTLDGQMGNPFKEHVL
ncbi:hypothetical protein CUMW_127670, partial [Citrus unshiu]